MKTCVGMHVHVRADHGPTVIRTLDNFDVENGTGMV
jgi:hypothetical protein